MQIKSHHGDHKAALKST